MDARARGGRRVPSGGQDDDLSNERFIGARTNEPAELVASIDWAQEQYRLEGAAEAGHEVDPFGKAFSVFDTQPA